MQNLPVKAPKSPKQKQDTSRVFSSTYTASAMLFLLSYIENRRNHSVINMKYRITPGGRF
jgi:hypothetical protein